MKVLSSLLEQCSPKSSYREKSAWVVLFIRWLLHAPKDTLQESTNSSTARLKYLLVIFDRNPQWKQNFVLVVSDLFTEFLRHSSIADLGLTSSASFFDEFINRLQERILPTAPLEEDLSLLLFEAFSENSDCILIDAIDPQTLDTFLKLFSDDHELHAHVRHAVNSALVVLTSRVLAQSFTLQSELHKTGHLSPLQPEFALNKQAQKFFEAPDDPQVFSNSEALLGAIEASLQDIYDRMKEYGVRVHLVHLIESQRRRLVRIRLLLNFVRRPDATALNFRMALSQTVLDIQHQQSFRLFLSDNLALLTKRIVKANSHVGEHYLTETWDEFKRMYSSALGGGAVTSLTVFLKFLLGSLKLTGFPKGLLDGLNYSGSFLGIQIMGWTLATKQPSATAPYLATALQRPDAEAKAAIAALIRTQFIAVLGNLVAVFPICFTIAWTLSYFGTPVFQTQEALIVQSSTNLFGPSLIYAAFTGVLLFLSSLVAGWFENWFIVNRMEARIKNSSFMHRWFKMNAIMRFSKFVSKNTNPLAANISLGFLLGMSPPIMKFFGLPLDVRHVTLSMGGFAATLPQVLPLLDWVHHLNAVAGILCIGAVNISVSFSLAFLLACASSQVRASEFVGLIGWGLKLAITRPWSFLIPPKIQKS